MMKERVEDLGRMREKLARILDSELFEAVDMHDEAFMQRFKDEDQLDTLRMQLYHTRSKCIILNRVWYKMPE